MSWIKVLPLLVIVPLLLTALPSSAHSSAGPVFAVHPLTAPPALINYSTPAPTGVAHVATAPDGSYVVATSTGDHAYLFGTSSSTPLENWSLPGNATSTMISLSGPAGTPEVLLTANNSAYLYSVSGASPIWTGSNYKGDGSAVKGSVDHAAISQDGNALAVVATFVDPGTNLPGFNVSYYTNPLSSPQLAFYSVVTGQSFTDLSMDTDGSWFVVGSNDANGNGAVFVFSGNQGSGGQKASYTAEWSPIGGLPNPGPAERLSDAVISGDGSHMFATAVTGFFAATVASQSALDGDTSNTFIDALSVSSSTNGCQVLVAAGTRVTYLNASATAGCSSYAISWSTVFPAGITSAVLAASSPDYFEVSWSTSNVGWYYLYPGMPQSSTADFRSLVTSGAILSVALSANEATLAVGQAYQVSANSWELTIAPDEGIPTPPAALTSAVALSPSAGDPTASLSVTWSLPSTVVGFTGISLSVVPQVPGGNSVLPKDFSVALPGPVTVGGLSFSTNYTVTVVISAFQGQRTSTSVAIVVTTAAAPPALDPFVYLEYGSIGLVVAGAVAYVAWRTISRQRGSET